MACNLTDEQIERWKQFKESMLADQPFMDHNAEVDRTRIVVRREILNLLEEFQNDSLNLEELKITFDHKTRTDWDVFGLKGLSGAMFLNMLVKYIPDQESLSRQLHEVLRLPQNRDQARQQMLAFDHYLAELINSGEVSKKYVQPARIPYLISAFWHMQDAEEWPIYYISGRRALNQEGVYSATNNPINDYFTFRECYRALAKQLELKFWETEHLLVWYDERRSSADEGSTTEPVEPISIEKVPEEVIETIAEPEDEVETVEETLSHSQIQWLLAKIGRKLGCRIWIAANDHNRTWQGERLGDMSIKELPAFWLDPDAQRIISLIDVLWIKGHNQVAAAFEVEHTTSIYSGLLRMSDLMALSPNLNFPLYIVAPEARMDKVRRELSRPTFQALELNRQCGYFSFEDLLKNSEAILKWANDPSAIDNLASRVPDLKG